MGMDVTLVAPPTLIPRDVESLGVRVTHDLADLGQADIVYLLRMQLERQQPGANFIPSLREYAALYGMTRERLRTGQKVMHPGPINRGIEISAAVADDPDTLIEQQVESGLAVRMAILYRTIVGMDEGEDEEDEE
jgi:aspartate carbamoyltransferase catalytic subunit